MSSSADSRTVALTLVGRYHRPFITVSQEALVAASPILGDLAEAEASHTAGCINIKVDGGTPDASAVLRDILLLDLDPNSPHSEYERDEEMADEASRASTCLDVYKLIDKYDLLRPRRAIDARLRERLMQRTVTPDALLATYENHPGVIRIVSTVLSIVIRSPPLPFALDAESLSVMIERSSGRRHWTLVLFGKNYDDSYAGGFVVCKIPQRREVDHGYPGGISGRWLRHICDPDERRWPNSNDERQRWLAIPFGYDMAVYPNDIEKWIGLEEGDDPENPPSVRHPGPAIAYHTLQDMCAGIVNDSTGQYRNLELVIDRDLHVWHCTEPLDFDDPELELWLL